MKIAFLYVNRYAVSGIPIGLSYLISILKNLGHEISLFETTFYDFNYTAFNTSGEIGERGKKIIADFNLFIERNKPGLIGVSSASLCLNFAIKMLESPGQRPLTVFGGVGATVDYINLIKREAVDYICVGFGEECLPKLVENLESRKNLENIPNLVYKENGKIIKNTFSQSIDLSRLPMPDWRLFDKKHFDRIFKGEPTRWGHVQLTRGCPFNCSYCVNAYYHKELGMKIQRVPIEKIIEEIRVLSKEYRLDIIRIFDECFGFGNTGHYRRFAKLYKETTKLPTIIATRPEVITPEIIEILKDINCISVSVGIEVGNKSQREKLLNRRVSNDVIRRAFELLHKAKIRASAYNIIGFPDDTREKIFETIKLNRACKPDFINLTFLTPDPKTDIREYCVKHGLLETDAITAYTERSIVKTKALKKDELYGLYRTFEYYVNLPEKFYPLIENFEKSGEGKDSLLEITGEASLSPLNWEPI